MKETIRNIDKGDAVQPATPAAANRAEAPVIRPTTVYSVEQARAALGLAKNCLPREIRLGRLRVSKRAGKYFVLGKWLISWLEAGEVRRAAAAANGALPGNGTAAD
jgi:hypothetical protein